MDVVSQSCVTWLPILWNRLRGRLIRHTENESSILLLPDDIIANILSRLTTTSAIQCLRVCKTFFAIFSSPSFPSTNLVKTRSFLLLQRFDSSNKSSRDIALHVLDRRHDSAGIAWTYFIQKKKYQSLDIIGSYNGFILFRNLSPFKSVLFIRNPITREQVTVTAPDPSYTVCGLFFHTPTKEHRILYLCKKMLHSKYSILGLRSKLLRKIKGCDEIPCVSRQAISVNEALHWMASNSSCSNSILVFQTESEEFVTMPHPGGECRSRESHKQMQLLEMDGHLGLCDIASFTELHLWVALKEHRTWVKKRTINFGQSVCGDYDYNRWPLWSRLEVLSVRDNELVFIWKSRQIFYYRLKENKMKQVAKEVIPKTGLASVVVHAYTLAFLHTDSFISLENHERTSDLSILHP